MNLYELNEAIEGFDLEIDEETGEVLNADALDALQLERDEKIENIALWIKDLLAEAAAIKAEKQALEKRQKTAENKAAWLKGYVQDALAGEKFKTARVAISYGTSKRAEITDAELIPEKYLEEQAPKVKKAEILADLKAGEVIPGAYLLESKSLRIK